jgi:hypothetical protein
MSRTFLLLAAAVVLTACDDTGPTAPQLADTGPTVPQLARTQVPITSSYRAQGTIGTAPRCDALGLLYVSLEGEGIESHVGRYTIRNSHCLNPATGEFTAGSFQKVSASGDELSGTYEGTSTVIQAPAPVGIFAIEGQLTFTGGTGRFANATGSQEMVGTQTSDFSQPGVPTTVELSMTGTISTVGSTR